VSAITTGHVTRILEPIWSTKAETAARVQGRIETVLDFAKVHGWRTGENPARWKGHLDNALPARAKVSKVEHHARWPGARWAPSWSNSKSRKALRPWLSSSRS
jgi:hypothetical protein